MKTIRVLTALALVLGLLALPGSALGETKMKVLGEDPVGDAPPALDLMYLAAGRAGKDLEIHIGVNGMFPAAGGYPMLPGIQWSFISKGRTFIAEAYVDGRRPYFLLFEDMGDSYVQLDPIEGTYDWTDGFIRMLVPLKAINAKKGTRIVGIPGGADVDAHVHLAATDYVADTLATTKAFIVP
jgi:hypothetical protein